VACVGRRRGGAAGDARQHHSTKPSRHRRLNASLRLHPPPSFASLKIACRASRDGGGRQPGLWRCAPGGCHCWLAAAIEPVNGKRRGGKRSGVRSNMAFGGAYRGGAALASCHLFAVALAFQAFILFCWYNSVFQY